VQDFNVTEILKTCIIILSQLISAIQSYLRKSVENPWRKFDNFWDYWDFGLCPSLSIVKNTTFRNPLLFVTEPRTHDNVGSNDSVIVNDELEIMRTEAVAT
jgi:hypothetical protein